MFIGCPSNKVGRRSKKEVTGENVFCCCLLALAMWFFN